MKSVFAALLSLAACTVAFADITLVRDGQPQAVIGNRGLIISE
jgi:hypothetical protein